MNTAKQPPVPWGLFTSTSKSVNVPGLTGTWEIIHSAADRAAWFLALIREGAAMIPGSTGGDAGRGFMRFNVGCPCSKPEDGLSRLIAAIHQLQG
ncbi:hypothetical protein [Pantoea sp. AS142]|uniref:hypothetical protein n=1 Tax=Pantoea sp. AS142 TaxID=3081292 RepID=UPI003016B997